MRRSPLLLALGLLACAEPEPPTTDDTDPAPVDVDRDGVPSDVDCDDEDPAVHPDAAERCNGVDDDCDRLIDVDDPDVAAIDLVQRHQDVDGDGYGVDATAPRCAEESGWSDRGGDCDDADATVSPDAAEVCGGVDEDCDGLFDADDPDVIASGASWFLDGDGDGVGAGAPTVSCAAPGEGWVTLDGDCDDAAATTSPYADERCNGVDDDCDGDLDLDDPSLRTSDLVPSFPDVDGDDHGAGASSLRCPDDPAYAPAGDDCDDADPQRHPGAPERCDGTDGDCDPTTGTPDLGPAEDAAVVDPIAALLPVREPVPDYDFGLLSLQGLWVTAAVDDVQTALLPATIGHRLELTVSLTVSLNAADDPYAATCVTDAGPGRLDPTPAVLFVPYDVEPVVPPGGAQAWRLTRGQPELTLTTPLPWVGACSGLLAGLSPLSSTALPQLVDPLLGDWLAAVEAELLATFAAECPL